MDDEGVVEYDKDRGIIESNEEVEQLEFYLDVVPEREISRSEYYLGLSLVAAALVTAIYVGAVPFTAISKMVWMTVIVVAFLVSAIVDLYFERYRRLGHEGPPQDVE